MMPSEAEDIPHSTGCKRQLGPTGPTRLNYQSLMIPKQGGQPMRL